MEQRNLIVAAVLSLAIFLGFQFFYELPRQRAIQAQQQAEEALRAATAPAKPATAPGGATPSVASPAVTPAVAGHAVTLPRDEALKASERVAIRTPRVSGSLALTGGRLDDITLTGYRETLDPASPRITMLNPTGAADAVFAEFGWTAAGATANMLPGSTTKWTADRAELTPEQPVTLTWDNGQGLKFTRQYSVDRDFMITIAERVENSGAAALEIYPFALISRAGTPPLFDNRLVHEGLIGNLGGTLKEHKYGSIKGEALKEALDSTGGWIGITDKYWLISLVPGQKEAIKADFRHALDSSTDIYQVDYTGAARALPAGGSAETTHRLFAGAKEVRLLQRYERDLGIARFDYAVDWGWFFFLTKPIFLLLDWIYGLVGNFGVAILLLTVTIKALFFPLANRSYVMMSKMKNLAPKLAEFKEKFGDDKAKLNQEMMALYKREKVNPLAGCLPMILQIPVFFSLYKVLFVTIEMRQTPFFGWIQDLSQPDPTTVFNLFGLIPWTPPEQLMFGGWPLIMGVTMFLQQRLNPAPTDPVQAKIFQFMPLIFMVMLAHFPSGLVIYWAWNNTLSMAQQWYIMKRQGAR